MHKMLTKHTSTRHYYYQYICTCTSETILALRTERASNTTSNKTEHIPGSKIKPFDSYNT